MLEDKLSSSKLNCYRLVRFFFFHLVVKSGQRLDEDVDALVAELVSSGREEEQGLVLNSCKKKKIIKSKLDKFLEMLSGLRGSNKILTLLIHLMRKHKKNWKIKNPFFFVTSVNHLKRSLHTILYVIL